MPRKMVGCLGLGLDNGHLCQVEFGVPSVFVAPHPRRGDGNPERLCNGVSALADRTTWRQSDAISKLSSA